MCCGQGRLEAPGTTARCGITILKKCAGGAAVCLTSRPEVEKQMQMENENLPWRVGASAGRAHEG